MTDRIVDPGAFIADGARVPWKDIEIAQKRAYEKLRTAPPLGLPTYNRGNLRDDRERRGTVELRWCVADAIGAPPCPFSVFVRRDSDVLAPLNVTAYGASEGTYLLWNGPGLLTLEVDAQVDDPSKPMALWGFRGWPSLASAVGVSPAVNGSGTYTLTVRAGYMSSALISNGSFLSAQGAFARDIAAEGKWEPIEIVGLPYDPAEWDPSSYNGKEQGLVHALTDPFSASIERVKRAGPLAGWYPTTGDGHVAPPWTAPDPGELVTEVVDKLLPHVPSLFTGVAPRDQRGVTVPMTIDPPIQDGNTAPTGTSTSNVPVLGALLLAGTTDPFNSLATGFGTGYTEDDQDDLRLVDGDFMIVAHYADGIDGGGQPVEYCAIVPSPSDHHFMAPVTNLTAARARLVHPVARDAAWRETVQLAWDATAPSAMLGRPAGVAAARYDPSGTGPASALNEGYPSGGYRSVVPTPTTIGNATRVALPDIGRTLPLDGSTDSAAYAIAQQDVFGVWSTWRDVSYDTASPAAPTPAVVSVTCDATYGGSTVCASKLTADVVVDWKARSPATLEVLAVVFEAPWSGAPTPAGVSPTGPAPAGAVRHDITVVFAGDTPSATTPGAHVDCLDPTGANIVAPGTAQGESRRYRITLSGFTLDFSSTDHYGVATWARQTPVVQPTASGVTPQPVRTFCSSPVPIIVPAVPLPLVPLGSVPDPENRSHVGLSTNGLGGAAKVVVWTSSETQLRTTLGIGAIPADQSLSQRFVALKQAYQAASETQRRQAFTRVGEVVPGTPSVDASLPRGSREIHMYAVTATTGANIDSPWPTSPDQLQAAAAPTVVPPKVPQVSARYDTSPGATRIALDIIVDSTIPVGNFAIHRTYNASAVRSASSMGPPVATVPATPSPEPPGTAGTSYTATFVDTMGPDWRPALYRVVALPAPTTADREQGVIGVRSESALVRMQLPPSAPDISPVDVDDFDTTGIVLRFSTNAPTRAVALGPFTLEVIARDGAGAALTHLRATLDQIPVTSTVVRPAGAATGVITRDDVAAGRIPLAAWFSRSQHSDAFAVEIVITDPLGRVTTERADVPAGPLGPITLDVTNGVVMPNGIVYYIDTDAPDAHDPQGDFTLAVAVTRPPLHIRVAQLAVAIPDIPDATKVHPGATDPIVVGDIGGSRYGVLIRTQRPFEVHFALVAPDGRSASSTRSSP